jgi:hypothetical protein
LESERDSLNHATTISRIIEETFTEKGYNLGEFRLNQERVAAASSKLVGELPDALRSSRNRALNQDFNLGQPALLVTEQDSREQLARREPIIAANLDRSLDDQVVEQKVSRTLEMLTEQSSNRESIHVEKAGHHSNRQPTVHDLGANGREHNVLQHVLVK